MREYENMQQEQQGEQKKPSFGSRLADANSRVMQPVPRPQKQLAPTVVPSPPQTFVGMEVEPPKRRSRKKLNRTNRMEIRVTDRELEWITAQAERSGRSQGEYLRERVLYEPQKPKAKSPATAEEIAVLDAIRAELGRIGGLLKSTIKPNEGSSNITREEWETIFQMIRDLQRLKEKIQLVLARRTNK